MNGNIFRKIKKKFTSEVYKETPLFFLTEPTYSNAKINYTDYVIIKSKLHHNKNFITMVPNKSICRDV